MDFQPFFRRWAKSYTLLASPNTFLEAMGLPEAALWEASVGHERLTQYHVYGLVLPTPMTNFFANSFLQVSAPTDPTSTSLVNAHSPAVFGSIAYGCCRRHSYCATATSRSTSRLLRAPRLLRHSYFAFYVYDDSCRNVP